MDNFKDRVVFVIGVVSGIGFVICKVELLEGMKVMMVDIEVLVFDMVVLEMFVFGDVVMVECDVLDLSVVNCVVDVIINIFGKVYFVCNNVGVSSGGFMDGVEFGDWDWVIGVNYFGVIYGCQVFVLLIK